MDANRLRETLEAAIGQADPSMGAAVLIPLVDSPEGPAVLLEVRALTLDVQPGEVCLPGGHIEAGETPTEAAVRETCEELLVKSAQIELVGELAGMTGPGSRPLHVVVGLLHDYRGTFSPGEVDRTFTLPLDYLLAHDPTVYEVELTPHHPDDFPWHLVPGGRDYPWSSPHQQVPFYLGTDPLVWGATARVLHRFSQVLRAAEAV